MSKEIKTIIKIMTIMIMTIAILLILSQNAFAISRYSFDCYGKTFTVGGIGANDEYALSWELWQASTIGNFDNSNAGKNWNNPGKTVYAACTKGGNDGYYMMRRWKNSWLRLCK